MIRDTRPIRWIKAARKDFEDFPPEAREHLLDALTFAAAGAFPGIGKPMKGFGSGIYELALRFHTDAYRVVYAVPLGDAVWVIHAFQKKSKAGIKTRQAELKLIRTRLVRLKEELR
jgi:phage-related protein